MRLALLVILAGLLCGSATVCGADMPAKKRPNVLFIAVDDLRTEFGSNVENDTHAPLLISVPGMATAGQKTDALAELVDVYPTLAELCGLPLPAHLEGTSLVPVLSDAARTVKTAAFSQYLRTVEKKPLMGYSMRTDRYRFTRWVHRDDHSQVEAVELYDHLTDPQENVNIADEPGSAELVARLTGQWLEGWRGAQGRGGQAAGPQPGGR